jgi:30S ribosomal protein S31
MGKGDVKTKRGKIINGSYGVSRPKKKSKPTVKSEQKVDNQKK